MALTAAAARGGKAKWRPFITPLCRFCRGNFGRAETADLPVWDPWQHVLGRPRFPDNRAHLSGRGDINVPAVIPHHLLCPVGDTAGLHASY